MAFEQTLHPHGDPREYATDLVIRRRRQRPELERAPFAGRVGDAIEEQRVEMEVQIQSAAKGAG